jgi:hypothetical protein
VPEEDVELRKRIEAKQQSTLANLVVKPQTVVQHDVETQSVSELEAAKAALDTLQATPSSVDIAPMVEENPPELPESNPPPPDASQIQASTSQIDEKMADSTDGGAA